MAANASHERNLLFAGLGLQLSLLTKEQLVRAFSEWILNKNRSLGEILVQQKAITPEQQKAIEGAVEAQIENDGGEVQSLGSVKNSQEIETCFKSIEDQELQMALTIMHCLQSRKIVGNGEENVTNAMPLGLDQPLPIKKALEQRFQRTNFLDAGNLGEIWFAKDEELNRTVVLKYIKGEQHGNSFTKALFNLEGEVTGYLEHPAVVPVYSMGQDDIGRSFYAMRYIRGRKLTRAIADYHAIPASSIGKRREALTELLQAFQTACLAIEYAHSKGVLHCDLKPDNIVVGPFGETLVIDWGLAMVTNPTAENAQEVKNLENISLARASGEMAGPYSPSQSSRPGLHSSQGGMRKFVGGTPAYMAPEQMRATRGGEVKEVNHSSDIFGLGAILYHLLTSRAPYFPNKEKHEVYAEFIRRIEKGVFPQPRQLDSSKPKPLEAIVLKAMAASPGDRYGSARELAEEVKRWLADEPVNAYQENAWERSRRWARNNRTAVVAGVVLILCLGIGGMGNAYMTQSHNKQLQASEKSAKESEQKAQAQERLANKQRELAEKREAMAIASVKQYAEAVEKNPDLKNKPELESLRKELLKEPIHFFKELSDQLRSEKNPSKKSLNDLATGLHSLAYLTDEIGNQEDAILSYKEAIVIRESLIKANPTNSEYQSDLASLHNNLAILYKLMIRLKEAEENYQKALVIHEALVKSNPTNSKFQSYLALLHINLANLYRDTNRPKEAEESYQKGLSIQESLAQSNPTYSKYQSYLALSHFNLAIFYKATNRQKEAEASYQKALAIQESLVKANPTNSAYQSNLAGSHHNLANLYKTTNQLKEAEASYQKALGIRESIVKANQTNSKFQSDLALLHTNLAGLYLKTNRLKEAEAGYQKALAIQESLVRANPTNSEYQSYLAGWQNDLANFYKGTNRQKEAEASYQNALAIQESLVKANPTNSEYQSYLASHQNDLAALYFSTNRQKEAEAGFQKALFIQEALVKANPTNSEYQFYLASWQNNLAALYLSTNRQKEAEAGFQKTLVIREILVKANPTNSEYQSYLASSHNNLATLYKATNRQKDAEASYQKALAIRESLVKANPTNSEYQSYLASYHYNLASLYSATDRQKDAEASYQNALAIYESLVKANPTNSGFQTDLNWTKNYLANLRNDQAWKIVSLQDKKEEDYQKGFLLAQEGLNLNPQNRKLKTTLGLAHYRVKQFAAGLETLQKSNAFNSKSNGKEDPADLAFLAMTCHQLNKKTEAETYIKKLQEAMKDKKNSENKEYQGFLKEAEALLKK